MGGRRQIFLAGVAVAAGDAVDLIWRLRILGHEETADRIVRGLAVRTLPIELRDRDHDAILRALDFGLTASLANLREVLHDRLGRESDAPA